MKPTVIFIFSLMATSLLPAQKPGDKDTAPLALQGEMLPAVSAFSEEGERLPLQQLLKGRYGVIVFGCLT